MLEIDGRLVRGSVEVHLRAADWYRHGHEANPTYDEVVLHAVLEDDLDAEVRTRSGRSVPTVVLSAFLTNAVEQVAAASVTHDLGTLGARTCLPTLAGGQESLVRDVLRRAGWQRLVEKQLRFAQDLERLPAAEVLYRGLLDGLGLTRNRHGMALVGENLSLATIEALCRELGDGTATALLLATGAFLPLSDQHAMLADITPQRAALLHERFTALASRISLQPVSPAIWVLNRVRPTNHPVRRLASLGMLLESAGTEGLLGCFLRHAVPGRHGWRAWLESSSPALGRSRSDQLIANVCAPFLAAYAERTGNDVLADEAGLLWEALPGSVDDALAKATLEQIVGKNHLRLRTALEVQGLHHIGRHGCRELRCFECPIAALALRYEPAHVALSVTPYPLPPARPR
jgi:hypothetical protein